MRRHPPPTELIKFLQPYERAVQKLALSVRSLVLEEMAPCHENIYDAYNAVAMGYGPSERLSDGVFHIAVYAKGVNLGFNHGANLHDPNGILEGAGKQIRHIKIRTEADLARPEVRSYVRRAKKLALDDTRKLGEPGPKPERTSTKTSVGAITEVDGVVSVVKAIYPKHRRP
jgi:hypothetical protein